MILVDTSVWIDHLHSAEATLTALLARDEVATHPLVIQELALGSIKNRNVVLDALASLRQCPVLTHDELLTLVSSHSLWGHGLSPADAHLLGAVLLQPSARLWTRDKRLHATATAIGAAIVNWP